MGSTFSIHLKRRLEKHITTVLWEEDAGRGTMAKLIESVILVWLLISKAICKSRTAMYVTLWLCLPPEALDSLCFFLSLPLTSCYVCTSSSEPVAIKTFPWREWRWDARVWNLTIHIHYSSRTFCVYQAHGVGRLFSTLGVFDSTASGLLAFMGTVKISFWLTGGCRPGNTFFCDLNAWKMLLAYWQP